MKSRCMLVLVLLLMAALAPAEDGAALRLLTVEELPDGEILRYAVMESQSGHHLVVESRGPDGTVAFHVLDYVDGGLRARVAAASALPARFLDPPDAIPETRSIAGMESRRFWVVGAEHSPVSNLQLVEFAPLAELRYVDTTAARSPELPPDGAGLAIGYIVTDADRALRSRCVLEFNLARPAERLTPTCARWVLVQGTPHLLVGMASDRGGGPWPVLYRLYSRTMELVSQSPVAHYTDPNRFPQPVMADLDGDGEDEVIVMGRGGGPSLAVMKTGTDDPSGRRVLALNDCTGRMKGPDVSALQRELERRGYDVGPHGIDGWYGPDTRAAVVRLQRDEGLPVTGVVDQATWGLLGW